MARALAVLGFALVVLAGMGGYGVGAEETATLEELVGALEARLARVEGGVAPVSANLAPDGSIVDLDVLLSADPVIVLVCAQTDLLAGMGLNPVSRSMMPALVAIRCARAPAAP